MERADLGEGVLPREAGRRQAGEIMGIFGAGFKGTGVPWRGAGERKQVVPTEADEGNRCGGQVLPAKGRYKKCYLEVRVWGTEGGTLM